MASPSDLSMSRATQRKLRLMAIEQEEAQSDLEALRLTEEQRQTLMRPFMSVKVEFSDLDGLSWTPGALRRRCRTTASRTAAPSLASSTRPSPASPPAFTVLTNTESLSRSSSPRRLVVDDDLKLPPSPSPTPRPARTIQPIVIMEDQDDIHEDLKTPVATDKMKH